MDPVKDRSVRGPLGHTRSMQNENAPREGIADDFAASDTARPFGSYLSVINGGE